MTHLLSSIILIFVGVFSVNCQSKTLANVSEQTPQIAKPHKTAKDEFLAKTFRSKTGKKMPYRLFLPDGYDKNKKYPLVLWLHGGGGRGNDNLKQITGGNTSGFQAWVNPKHQAKYPSIVLAPQCPTGEQWTSWDDEVNLTDQTKIVLELIEDLQKTYSIDNEKLCVSGQSMGGFATWALIAEYPDMFAAAVPVCAGGNETKAARMIGTPIWAFHGELDTAVKVERSRRMIAAVEKAGGTPRYTEYKNEGHVIWDRVFTEFELLPWVFAQKKTAGKIKSGDIRGFILGDIPKNVDAKTKYLFYLHGKIVEDQGMRAKPERHGAYEYEKILESFRAGDFTVVKEVRPKDTDIKDYAAKFTRQINELIEKGVPPQNITVVGASKGAWIAMLVSTYAKNRNVNFVMLAGCAADEVFLKSVDLHGNVLSVYEVSDTPGSCQKFFTDATGLNKQQQTAINTGLGHGFLYHPMKEWFEPTIEWAKSGKL